MNKNHHSLQVERPIILDGAPHHNDTQIFEITYETGHQNSSSTVGHNDEANKDQEKREVKELLVELINLAK
jgi:hypothetical protein